MKARLFAKVQGTIFICLAEKYFTRPFVKVFSLPLENRTHIFGLSLVSISIGRRSFYATQSNTSVICV